VLIRRGIDRSVLLGAGLMILAFAAMISLPSLRGSAVIRYLIFFMIAFIGYGIAVLRLKKSPPALMWIWFFAIVFRVLLLFTSPTLSDDVFRYLWDGHLLTTGINPYAFKVDSILLDAYTTPLRASVAHAWMASPYLPTAQFVFALVESFAAQQVLAFQIAAIVFDLVSAWLIMDLLRRVRLAPSLVLLYLWNPLVIVEFAHGAHVDALMIFLSLAAFCFLLRAVPDSAGENRFLFVSIVLLAAATLTKALPILFVPLFIRRWGWKRLLLYLVILLGITFAFAKGAGWGLAGEMDGIGVFGAIRIYLADWKFNAGFAAVLDRFLLTTKTSSWLGEVIPAGLLALTLFFVSVRQLIRVDVRSQGIPAWGLGQLRYAFLLMSAYLLMSDTVHPWYVSIIIAFVPFLTPAPGEQRNFPHFGWGWLFFSAAVNLSYLAYLNPDEFREYPFVRWIEYLPLYGLLFWGGMRYIQARQWKINRQGSRAENTG
jgi:alpha-1,6-mannosyltransferase